MKRWKIGFLGGGQLARMSAAAAFRLGFDVELYSDRPEVEPLEQMIGRAMKGSFEDVDALATFAETVDVVTLENEFVDAAVLEEVRQVSGTPVLPSPETFRKIGDKYSEKKTFEEAGLRVAPYARIGGNEREEDRGHGHDVSTSADDVIRFGEMHGYPFLLKSSKGGYDGYGNVTVRDDAGARAGFASLGGTEGHELVAEAFVDFTHELAVQVARNSTGLVVYPCCETVQSNHINVAVRSPALVGERIRREAQEMAVAAMEAMDAVGLFAFEFFLTKDGELVLNESAPRPHNSGHYTLEGCATSQFENHVRAVCGLPLGSSALVRPAAVMINLLGTEESDGSFRHVEQALAEPFGALHHYGKLQSRPGRKMGHYTLLGEDPEEVFARAMQVTEGIEI
jgi:5-(carboxyamino)imidazole ribonucleotide synthase